MTELKEVKAGEVKEPVVVEEPVLLGVGRGVFSDYGKRVGMSFYKQRIVLGQR